MQKSIICRLQCFTRIPLIQDGQVYMALYIMLIMLQMQLSTPSDIFYFGL